MESKPLHSTDGRSAGVTVLRAVGRTVAERLQALGTDKAACLASDGLEAFAVRLWLARTAERTLDLQYYAWEDDVTGRLLANEILKAADRGVRVRLLLDDTTVIGRDKSFQIIDQHPSVEVRVFNATTWRAHGFLGFGIEFALGGWHLNHRMHNKAWIADGVAAVIGGRNIADRYFDGSGHYNFQDLDAVLIGTPVAEAGEIFETFWKSRVVQGVQAFLRHRRRRLRRRIGPFRRDLDASCAGEETRPYLEALHASYAVPERIAEDLPFDAVDDAGVVSDGPEKANDRTADNVVAECLRAAMTRAKHEVLIVSPYFVPGRDGTDLIETLVSRGVSVRIVTNSLAANDVTAVHSGYARYRKRLLCAGAEIHELRDMPGERPRIFGSSGASLHSKALVVDRTVSFVGSFNLDNRSAKLNTEMSVMVDDGSFAACVTDQFERLVQPARSYRLSLENGRIVWHGAGDDEVYRGEPRASWRQRIIALLVGLLPMEAQL